MAHKMGAGSTKNGRNSKGQRLGIKIFGNQYVKSGSIIVRQRGTLFKAGKNVGCGKDSSLYALINGYVNFNSKGIIKIK
jgi:large subunit ribosomal protein L27